MAADSLLGGVTDTLDASSKAIINSALGDVLNGATVTTNGATVVTGASSSGDNKSAMVATAALNGVVINDGIGATAVTANSGTVITTQGLAQPVSTANAQAYFDKLLDAAIPDAAAAANAATASAKAGVENAIKTTMQTLQSNGVANASVRHAQIDSTGDVKLDVSGTPGVVQALSMGNAEGTVTVTGAAAITVVGSGAVTVGGSTAAVVAGDSGNQKITGGAGKDTLFGGGGNDTIIGGSGDTIGFNGLGNYTIGGTDKTNTLLFSFDGIKNVATLLSYLTGVTESASGVTYHFGEGAAITLAGVSAADVTADMVKFTV